MPPGMRRFGGLIAVSVGNLLLDKKIAGPPGAVESARDAIAHAGPAPRPTRAGRAARLRADRGPTHLSCCVTHATISADAASSWGSWRISWYISGYQRTSTGL